MSTVADTDETLRRRVREHFLADEKTLLDELIVSAALDQDARARGCARAAELVRWIRANTRPSMMESFLAEYGLSTEEGVGLMCLAEALLRVPDADTIDELINDKIEPSDWGAHLGKSSSSLVNASTWALMLTGKLLDDDPARPAAALRELLRRVGEPVVRTAVAQSMKILGRQFVLGETIDKALQRAADMEAQGYTYSYDMLGEAARTERDARRYQQAYRTAIEAIGARASGDIRSSPGISVKLSALHPRYEYVQRERVLDELTPRALALARLACERRIGFNVDAEEANRLDLSLDVIERVLSDPSLAGWDGFGVVVQAYGKRAGPVIDWLYALAGRLQRKIMVRLVKGAYWDAEIKLAQEKGLDGFPVFTRKVNTDVSYLSCARRLLQRRDRIYPQFATHNAHTLAMVLEMAGDSASFEFQRLHGMGESLHDRVKKRVGSRCRIYAPVGAHRDLLAYLVRRLLENGANSSFVNQIVDESVTPERIARDPIDEALSHGPQAAHPAIRAPEALFSPRRNSRGWEINEPASVGPLEQARARYRNAVWSAEPLLATETGFKGEARAIVNPADPGDRVGEVYEAGPGQVRAALDAAVAAAPGWAETATARRSAMLRRAADLYQSHAPELFALIAREAGKTLPDAIAEVREAIDFLRYYADQAEIPGALSGSEACGVFVCISPWNFPLAIFTGQLAAALAAGNAVIAKPAEQTPLIAARGVALLRQAGIPAAALQFLPGDGPTVGAPLSADPRVDGVCFTGSIEVAQAISRSLARHAGADAAFIAETGGLNAMIVDSTALPEQAVRDILASAFQSAGQRCSALRVLYVQEDVRERLLTMLFGAMDELQLGDPWASTTDVGPLIDADAHREIGAYCERMAERGRLLKRLQTPAQGYFVAPTVLRVSGIGEVEREVFGPVLHVASFKAHELDAVVDAINARGYGLTFGLHTRIDDRVQQIVERIRVGNIYVNRNQIGAIVGSQPFGGEGLSGTGPKAGGPHYLQGFRRRPGITTAAAPSAAASSTAAPEAAAVQSALDRLDAAVWSARGDRLAALERALAGAGAAVEAALAACRGFDYRSRELPGPTGESNRLWLHPRGTTLCLGPGADAALAQAVQTLAAGAAALVLDPGVTEGPIRALRQAGAPVALLSGTPPAEALTELRGFAVAAYAGDAARARHQRLALAARDGAIKPLINDLIAPWRYIGERHLCIDTTAAGGNASLLASTDKDVS